MASSGYPLFRWLRVAFLLIVASCGRHEPTHEEEITVEHSALTSKGLSFFLPAGVQNGDVAISASGSLKIDDRAKVQPATAGAAILSQVAASPGGSSDIGVDTTLSALWSAGSATLRDRARVNGSVFANAALTQGSGVVITGPVTTAAGTVQPRPVAWSVQLPASSAASVDVASSTSKTIGPARYPSISVHSQATLTMTAGTYFVDSLSLDAGCSILVDDSAGPVTIYVLSTLVDHGTVTGKQTATPNLLLAYLGTAALVIDSPFSGALVAPVASVTFRPPQVGTTPSITGAIWGRDVEIGAGVIVEHHTSSVLAAAIAGSGDAGSLTPIAEGKATIGSTTYAVFSYQNSSLQNVHVPYGPQNQLSTSSASILSPNPAPPTWLKPGTIRGAVVYPLTTSSLKWTLGFRSATVTTSSTNLSVQTQAEGKGVTVGGTFVALQPDPDFAFQNSIVPTADSGTTTVGPTPMSTNVTGDGAFAVSIPIWVAPGRAGMQPDLSLEYNSRAGDGLLGFGWTLRGTSQITRCERTRARNGRTAPLTFGIVKTQGTAPDTTDALCLDGDVLERQTGSAVTYKTEHDRFALVRMLTETAIPNISNPTENFFQPETFEVRTKDGRILTYGGGDSTMEEPIESSLPPHRYAWSLSKVRDRSGNTMTVHYQNDFRTADHCVQQYISRIDYTGSDADGANKTLKSVVFVPESREDARTSFVKAFCTMSNVRFKEIQVLGPRPEQATPGGDAPKALLKSYRLTYQGAPTYSRPMLTTVTECDGAGVCKSPLQFGYETGDPDFNEVPINFVPDDTVQAGDLDGDGTDDLFYWSGNRITYQLSNGTADFGMPFSNPVVPTVRMADGTILQNAATEYDAGLPDTVRPLNQKFRFFDFDMDGRIDIALIHNVLGGQLASNVYIFHNDGGNPLTFTQIPGISYEIPTGFFNPSQGRNLSLVNPGPEWADLNGDGLVDSIRPIITVEDTGESVWDVRLNRVGGFDPPLSTAGLSPGWNGGRTLASQFVDRRAAGLFTRFGHETSFVYKTGGLLSVIDGDSLNPQVIFNPTNIDLTNIAWDYNYWIADLNGDGLQDIVLPSWSGTAAGTKDPANFQIHLAHGDGTFDTSALVQLLPSSPVNGLSNLRGYDYDQDGVEDLLAFDTSTQTQRNNHQPNDDVAGIGTVYRSAGNGTVFGTTSRLKTADGTTTIGPQVMLDFDGDGLQDFIGVAYTGMPDPGTSLFRHRGARANMMKSVVDGLGRRTVVTQRPIRQVQLQTSAGCSWPIYCVNKGVWFVGDVETDNGNRVDKAENLHDRYHYAGAESDLLGRGWLGVKQRFVDRLRVDNPGIVYVGAITTFENDRREPCCIPTIGQSYDYPFRDVAKSETVVKYRIGNVDEEDSKLDRTFEYDVVTGASNLGQLGNSFSIGLTNYEETESVLRNGALDKFVKHHTTSPTFWKYDTHGNLTHQDLKDDLADGTTTRTTADSTFTQDETSWLVGQMNTRTIVSQTPLGSAQRAWSFSPDGTTGLLNHVTYQSGLRDEQLDIDYVRDNHGLPKTITRSVPSGLKRVTAVTYDDFDGTFPQLILNAKEQPRRTFVHPGLGVLVADQDANGLRSLATFDGFGRPRSTKRPDGTGAQIRYESPAFDLGVYQIRIDMDGGAEARLNFDDWNREIAREVNAFGSPGFNRVRTKYDQNQVALPASVTVPSLTPEAATTPATLFVYDSGGRVVQQTTTEGTVYALTYDVNKTRFTGPAGRLTVLVDDGEGRIVQSTQTIGNSIGQASHDATTAYTYGPFGQVATITDAKGNVTQVAYDGSGRRTSLTDPDAGTTVSKWNGFNDLLQEADADGQVRTYIADELGRVRQTITPEGVAATDWDTATNGIGALGNTTSPDGVDCTYSYDGFGRLSNQSWTLSTGTTGADGAYDIGVTYDSAGRPSNITYPTVAGQTPLTIRQAYGTNGMLSTLFRGSNAIWTVNARDAAARVSLETAANGVSTSHDYTAATGLIHEIKSTLGTQTLRDLVYIYDENRNLQQRTTDGQVEAFGYDTIDRLITWEQGSAVTNPGTVFSYDDIGNLLTRQQQNFTNHAPAGSPTSQTTFTPGDGVTRGPHQIASSSLGAFGYDPRGDQTSAPGRTVAFTSFGLPRSISAGTATTTFAYDGANSRLLKKSGISTVVTLGGLFERRISGGTRTDVFHVAGEGRTVAQITWTENAAGTAITEQVQYLHDDHVGSIEAITSSAGSLSARQKFDPFGGRIGSAPNGIRVGFEELEQDDEFGLINMKGRIYDPHQGRFISVDPFVSNPFFSQDLNRYAFVRNSPLNYRDPSGFIESPVGGFDEGSGPSYGAGEFQGYGGTGPVQQQIDPEDPVPIGGTPGYTAVISMSGGDVGQDAWGNWTPIPSAGSGGPGPGWNGSMGPDVAPGSADDSSSRGPQISGPPTGGGGGMNPWLTVSLLAVSASPTPGAPPASALKLPTVPLAPPRVDLDANIKAAEGAHILFFIPKMFWFRNQVRNHGPWDYKQRGGQYENFGNFNYGATARALGLSRYIILNEAGRAQVAAGTSQAGWGHPGGSGMLPPIGTFPFGDDPMDQFWIIMGINYYDIKTSGAPVWFP